MITIRKKVILENCAHRLSEGRKMTSKNEELNSSTLYNKKGGRGGCGKSVNCSTPALESQESVGYLSKQKRKRE